jgi:hypothetical protein
MDKKEKVQILKSETPEEIFSGMKYAASNDDAAWQKLSLKLSRKPEWQKIMAPLAAMLVTAFALAMFSYFPVDSTETWQYVLQHRHPSELLSEFAPFLSESGDITISENSSKISFQDKRYNIEKLKILMPMLDRRPLDFQLTLQLLEPKSPLQRVSNSPGKQPESSDYNFNEKLELRITEGKRFSQVLDNRYEIVGHFRLSQQDTKIEITNLRVYDLLNKETVISESAMTIAEQETFYAKIEGDKNDVIAISFRGVK